MGLSGNGKCLIQFINLGERNSRLIKTCSFSNAEYENKVAKRRKGSQDYPEQNNVQNDCLLRGYSIKSSNKNRREIFLFPNRLEIPVEPMLIPVDEILSVNIGLSKDNLPTIMIKSTGKNEVNLSFEWRFEAEVNFDIFNLINNFTAMVSRLVARVEKCFKVIQKCAQAAVNSS